MNKRHKIVLYNPTAVFYDMPLALLSLASCFSKKDFEVVLIDGRMSENSHEKVLELMDDAICFGTTVLTGKPIEDAIEISRKVKNKFPLTKVVWGGWHTSLFPTQALEEESSIDITVQGQGEITFQEIVSSIINQTPLNEIKGICFRQNNSIIRNAPRLIEDMNTLPKVDYSFINVESYFAKKGQKQFDFISSIGCFYRCTFCADPYVFGRKFSAISASNMLDNLEHYYKQHQFESVNFQDETFFTYKKRVLEFSKGLIERKINIRWAATMRADQGDRLSQEEFNLLAKSGLFRVLVGVESGSQEMMDWLKKDIKIEQVLSTAEKCKKANIGIQFPFIVGFPEESEKAFRASVNFAIQLSNLSDNFKPVIFYYKPYPGTPITDDLIKNGYEMPKSMKEWSGFDYVSNSGPWVIPNRKKEIETLKFYIKAAKNKKLLGKPVKWVAQRRMRSSNFNFPIEKNIIELIAPTQRLS